MFCDYCATERLQRHVSSVDSDQAIRYFREPAERRRPIGEIFLQCARGHLFETEREHAIGSAGGNGLPCQEQRARACRTSIVEVDDWDSGANELIKRTQIGRASGGERDGRDGEMSVGAEANKKKK